MTGMYAMVLAASGGIWGSLHRVTVEMVDERLGMLQSLAVILCAMLAACTLVRTASSYIHGEVRFGWELLRPVALLICVMNFSLVCNAFDGLVNIFTRDIAEVSESSLSDLNEVISDAFGSLKDHQAQAARASDDLAGQEGWGFWKKIGEGLKIAASSFFKTSQVSLLTVMAFVGRLVTEVVFFVFEILAALYLAILRLLGPFVFALATPDRWKTGVATWIARYIQISLWVPVGFIVISLLTGFYMEICGMLINGSLESGAFIIGLGLIMATVAAIMAVPKISSWGIDSAGSGNAQSGLERSLQSIGRRIMR